MKKYPKAAILDKLHRGAVWSCIAVTLGGTALLGYRFYRYFTVVKPDRDALELKVLEVSVHIMRVFEFFSDRNFQFTLKEGLPQLDSANLIDHAPNLKS